MPTEDQTLVTPRQRTRIMMWLALAAIIATAVVAWVVAVKVALLVLSGALLAFALVRAVSPAPGPYGISIRSRAFDITLMVAAAVLIAVVTLSLPIAELG
ncbi:DUF3017 domain-containing protein [Pseudactinotalea terrae]|uniref:DUF3017 domain-containing protein n=1 Tax=Pseudactinotalea terrae TaxID=1743262 RepID=UPI0012E1513F|nr:DUF3017 domain-containing protein [Pseudactinotalea terrae]